MADLRYKVVVDDAEAKRKLSELLKGTGVQSPLTGMSEDAKKATASLDEVRGATVRVKEAQLANIEALRQTRIEQARHKEQQAELNAALAQGRIDAQQFRLEQAKLAAEEKKRAKELREQKKLIAENSEYGKLTRALNNVRKEAKEVQAEMFSLERRGYGTGAAYEALRVKSDALSKQTLYLDNAVKRIDGSLGQHQRNVGNYGEVADRLVPIIGRVNSQLASLGVSLDDLASKPSALKEVGNTLMGVGSNIVKFLISPIGMVTAAVAGLFMLFKNNKQVVMDFDSGLLNVSKTTGLSGDALQSLSDDIIRLSRSLKTVSAVTLTEYAAVAGQLGVKGREDIMAFTEALAMLETASDISGEEGGAKIARMLTLVDGGVQNVREFGDEIVNLGNNFAATESEILSNAESIAQNVGIYRIGRQEVLAFATATKAVGLEAELVGSTFSRTLAEFEKSIRSGKGVNDLLKIIGGTSQELSKRFREDAAGVFIDYVRGLNNIHKSGGSVNEALERTGIIAVRDQRVIASLASSGFDVLTDALDTVSNASGAMSEEFETASGKLVNQAERIGIAWDNLVLSIENGTGLIGKSSVAVIGYFADILEAVNKVSDAGGWGERITRGILTGATALTGPSNVVAVNKLVDGWFTKENSETSAEYYEAFANKTRGEQLKIIAGQEVILENQKKYNNAFGQSSTQANIDKLKSLLKDEDLGKSITFDEEEDAKAKRERERAENEAKRRLEEQKRLQRSIDEANEQARRASMTKEEKDILQIKDKYVKLWADIAEAREKGIAVNTSGLREAEAAEVKAYQDKVKADARKKEEEEAKKLYDSLIKEYATYQQKRQTIIEESEKAIAAFKKKGQYENAEVVRKQTEENLRSLSQSEIEASDKYKQVMRTIENASQSMLVDAFKTGKKQIYALVDGLETASKEEREALKKIFGDFFDKGIKDAEGGNTDAISQMAVTFDGLVASSADLLSNLEGGIDSLLSMVGAASQLAKQLGSFTKSTSLSALGGTLPMLGAFIGVIDSIGSSINARLERREAERQAQIDRNNERQLKSTEAVTKMLERQLELINEIYGNARLEEYSQKLIDIQKNWGALNDQLSGRYKMTGNEYVDNMLKRLNNGETLKELQRSITRGMLPGSNEFLKAIQTIRDIQGGKYGNVFGSLPKDIAEARKELMELERQVLLGNADEYTTQLYNQLQAQMDMYERVMNQLKEETTGNSFTSILSDVRNLFFENGENAADAWQKGFDKIFENYLSQKFSRDYLEKEMQSWYNLFDQYATDGVSDSERAGLQEEWNRIQREGQARLDQMREAMGLAIDNTSSSNTLSGAYARASQESIDILSGQTGAMRAHLSEIVQAANTQTQLITRALEVATSKLITARQIEVNTRVTAEKTTEFLPYLQGIEANTKSNLDVQLRAAGKFGF